MPVNDGMLVYFTWFNFWSILWILLSPLQQVNMHKKWNVQKILECSSAYFSNQLNILWGGKYFITFCRIDTHSFFNNFDQSKYKSYPLDSRLMQPSSVQLYQWIVQEFQEEPMMMLKIWWASLQNYLPD